MKIKINKDLKEKPRLMYRIAEKTINKISGDKLEEHEKKWFLDKYKKIWKFIKIFSQGLSLILVFTWLLPKAGVTQQKIMVILIIIIITQLRFINWKE